VCSSDLETDVIALVLGGVRGLIVGDVYCAPEVAARQARRFGSSAAGEVRRLVVHGVLHVLGYEHPDGEGRTSSPMWRRQERLLARLRGGR
jgi:probable rRNA maturation factor